MTWARRTMNLPLKEQVRHAMAVLEEAKAEAAFNLLKRIFEQTFAASGLCLGDTKAL